MKIINLKVFKKYNDYSIVELIYTTNSFKINVIDKKRYIFKTFDETLLFIYKYEKTSKYKDFKLIVTISSTDIIIDSIKVNNHFRKKNLSKLFDEYYSDLFDDYEVNKSIVTLSDNTKLARFIIVKKKLKEEFRLLKTKNNEIDFVSLEMALDEAFINKKNCFSKKTLVVVDNYIMNSLYLYDNKNIIESYVVRKETLKDTLSELFMKYGNFLKDVLIYSDTSLYIDYKTKYTNINFINGSSDKSLKNINELKVLYAIK